MSVFNNTTIANELYPVANAITSSNPFVVQFQTRDPTTADIQYPIQKTWLNTATDRFWFLKNFTTSSGVVFANWIEISSGANPVTHFTIDTATAPGTNPVFPDITGNVTITGGQVAAGTTSNVIQTDATAADGPNKYSIEIQRSQAVAVSTIGDNGVSHYNSAQFAVDANAFVTLAGGTTPAILGLVPDAHTPPGTSPVVPDGSGNIIVTGGQVAAGSTVNVIETQSLAANTLTIDIQRSQAVGVSTIGDNGVSHFNSAEFTVDANGFVSMIGGGPYISLTPFIVGTDVHSGFATIASAIAAAVVAGATNTTPMNVYVKPKADGTNYTENLTLSPGVNLISFGETVTNVGKLSYSSAGQVNIVGFTLTTNADFLLEVTGASASKVYFEDCQLNSPDHTTISFTSSSPSSHIIIKDCLWDLGTVGIAYYSMTGTGTIGIEHCYLSNIGNSVTATTQSSGAVNFYYTHVDGVLANSGTGGSGLFFTTINPGDLGLNVTAFTFNGTGANESTHGNFNSGTASAISIGAGATATITFAKVTSSNVNAITGAGTLNYAFIAFAGASSGHNVSVENALATLI